MDVAWCVLFVAVLMLASGLFGIVIGRVQIMEKQMAEAVQERGQTCGPLYKAGLERFTGMDPEKVPIFAAGFVSGEAEKIYLGACDAAMFRPSEEWQETVAAIVVDVAARYGLVVTRLDTSRGMEMWLCASQATRQAVKALEGVVENSREWHNARGLLCGVPHHRIDTQFHERHGFGERCDG